MVEPDPLAGRRRGTHLAEDHEHALSRSAGGEAVTAKGSTNAEPRPELDAAAVAGLDRRAAEMRKKAPGLQRPVLGLAGLVVPTGRRRPLRPVGVGKCGRVA